MCCSHARHSSMSRAQLHVQLFLCSEDASPEAPVLPLWRMNWRRQEAEVELEGDDDPAGELV